MLYGGVHSYQTRWFVVISSINGDSVLSTTNVLIRNLNWISGNMEVIYIVMVTERLLLYIY